MQSIINKVGNILKLSELIPPSLKSQIDKIVFSITTPQLRKHILLCSKLSEKPVFCIVHWNAPDFLLLNVSQIRIFYPNSKIYVLDNGSQPDNTRIIEQGLRRFNNITLFAASPGFPKWAMKIGADRFLFSHAKGLQFLLNYAAEQRDEIVCFLDQDCMLSNNIDDLFAKLGKNVILIGTRTGHTNNLIHASFMILQPMRIYQLFGRFSFFHESADTTKSEAGLFLEPYHGLSLKAKGKLLFLEWKPDKDLPTIASYSFQGKTYAWHAGYSSRILRYSGQSYVDGVPVSFLLNSRKQAIEFMKKIHEETINNKLPCAQIG